MTITTEEAKLLALGATSLSAAEREIIETVFTSLYEQMALCNLPAASDDRAAQLEAAMIRYIIDSRAP